MAGTLNADEDTGFALESARYAAAFWAILNKPRECSCELWRHPNDPDGDLCSWCEDAPLRELLDAHAEGEPPTLEELEEAD